MQKVKIPITLDPSRAAQRQLNYEGIVQFDELSRFEQVVQETQGEIAVNIHCKTDEQGLVVLAGNAKAHVTVECQRCNGDLGLDLEQNFAYTPISAGSELDELPDYYDVVEVDEHGEVNVRQLIEDELILAIPIVPMHDEDACRYSEAPTQFGELKPEETDKPNPFDILKQLKKDS